MPKGTPSAIRDKLYEQIGSTLKDPNIVARLREMGAQPGGQSPAEVATFITAETAKWKKVAKESGAKID